MEKVTVASLQQMKREGRKIVGVVLYDFPTAQIADRAGVDLVSVGDSVGANLWGQPTEVEVTPEDLLIACKAVRRGTRRALVSCDVPQGAVAAGIEAATVAALRLAREGGAARLALTHLSTRYDQDPSPLLAQAAEEYQGELLVAHDGLTVEIPLPD